MKSSLNASSLNGCNRASAAVRARDFTTTRPLPADADAGLRAGARVWLDAANVHVVGALAVAAAHHERVPLGELGEELGATLLVMPAWRALYAAFAPGR